MTRIARDGKVKRCAIDGLKIAPQMFWFAPLVDNKVNSRGPYGGKKDRTILERVSCLTRDLVIAVIALDSNLCRERELNGVTAEPLAVEH